MSTEPATERDAIAWTPRQREVLDLVARGLTNGQIADALGITIDGAKWHVSEIIARLGVDTREEAAEVWRKQNGVVARWRTFARRRVTHAVGWVAAGGVATAAAVVAVPLLFLGGDEGAPEAEAGTQFSGQWERLPDPPLSPRTSAIGVWTGVEVLFVGGDDWVCPPGADCVGPSDAAFSDGAAWNPATGLWRTLAPAPAGLRYATTAVVGQDIFFLARTLDAGATRGTAFLRYSLPEDRWSELEFPVVADMSSYRVVAAGDRLIAYPGSHERGASPDLIFEPVTGSWSELPPHPGGPGFDLSITSAGGHLFLLDHELVPNPGSLGPSLTRVSRYDRAAGSWESLPTTGMMGGFGFVSGEKFVDAALGGADGGEVKGWGRMYPHGGVLDLRTGSWAPLPNIPDTGKDATSSGVFDATGARYHNTGGSWLLNFETAEWSKMPRLDPQDPFTQRPTVLAAGRDAVVFGGVRWDDGDGPFGSTLLADAWIWRAP